MRAPPNLAADWAAFAAEVEARLAAGAQAYADQSLAAAPADLAAEVEEELLDVAGWSFILWRRLRSLRTRLPCSSTEARTSAQARAQETAP
jgi:hypothetical protein